MRLSLGVGMNVGSFADVLTRCRRNGTCCTVADRTQDCPSDWCLEDRGDDRVKI